MNGKLIRGTGFVLLLCILTAMLWGCGRKNDGIDEPSAPPEAAEELSDEQALSAIRNYCFTVNPGLKDIIDAGEYPTYWEVTSGDEREIVVLFRSYTGALVRYYIDRITGETFVTEYVPGITPEEQRTEESFNAGDYLSEN